MCGEFIGVWSETWREIWVPRYCIGRTGDSSFTSAQSPFNRMGQHFGFAKNSTTLRRHLVQYGAVPESSAFRLIALGPIEPVARTPDRREHDQRRDSVTAMKQALAKRLASTGLKVINRVVSRRPLDKARFMQVWAAFAKAFPQLATVAASNTIERHTEC